MMLGHARPRTISRSHGCRTRRTLPAALIVASVEMLLGDKDTASAQWTAFVVGIAKYQNVDKLSSPDLDAPKMYDLLVAQGFNVTLVEPNKVDRSNLLAAWGDFVEGTSANDDVVVYYSGHGAEVGGVNYMV